MRIIMGIKFKANCRQSFAAIAGQSKPIYNINIIN